MWIDLTLRKEALGKSLGVCTQYFKSEQEIGNLEKWVQAFLLPMQN